jgi:hypothetical protein
MRLPSFVRPVATWSTLTSIEETPLGLLPVCCIETEAGFDDIATMRFDDAGLDSSLITLERESDAVLMLLTN